MKKDPHSYDCNFCNNWNQMKNDPRSYDRNFYNCVKKPEKNSGLLYAIVKIAIITARIILHLMLFLLFVFNFLKDSVLVTAKPSNQDCWQPSWFAKRLCKSESGYLLLLWGKCITSFMCAHKHLAFPLLTLAFVKHFFAACIATGKPPSFSKWWTY